MVPPPGRPPAPAELPRAAGLARREWQSVCRNEPSAAPFGSLGFMPDERRPSRLPDFPNSGQAVESSTAGEAGGAIGQQPPKIPPRALEIDPHALRERLMDLMRARGMPDISPI